MSYEEFALSFRDEHRLIRDTLLDLTLAFGARKKDDVIRLLNQTAVLTGPHFRYEEEALYPALVETFGEEYIQKLLHDHDLAIGTAKRLVEIASKEKLTEDDAQKGIRLTRSVLPHVSDCEGLSIMVERFKDETVRSVLDARKRAKDANVNLLEWAEKIRTRPFVLPA